MFIHFTSNIWVKLTAIWFRCLKGHVCFTRNMNENISKTHIGLEFNCVSQSQALLISAGGWWPQVMSPGVLEAMASLTRSSRSQMGMSGCWNTSPVFSRTGRDFRGLIDKLKCRHKWKWHDRWVPWVVWPLPVIKSFLPPSPYIHFGSRFMFKLTFFTFLLCE